VIAARITAVVDGDTIKVKAFNAPRKLYTVRLIGIDTSETHRPGRPVECGGRRASGKMLALAFTNPADTDGDSIFDEEAGEGRRVTLVTDPTQDTFDRYGRLLAYVTTSGGVSLQAAQLSAGWAKVYVFRGRPFRQVSRFRAASARARTGRRGVWRLCSGDFHRSL
jgi:micrococcal nuclease